MSCSSLEPTSMKEPVLLRCRRLTRAPWPHGLQNLPGGHKFGGWYRLPVHVFSHMPPINSFCARHVYLSMLKVINFSFSLMRFNSQVIINPPFLHPPSRFTVHISNVRRWEFVHPSHPLHHLHPSHVSLPHTRSRNQVVPSPPPKKKKKKHFQFKLHM